MKAFLRAAAGTLVLLALPALAQPLNPFITLEPYHANGLYKAGETYGWTVRAPMGMSTQDPLTYDYTIRENNQAVIASGTLDLSSGSATITGTLDHPAMAYVRLAPVRTAPPAPVAASNPAAPAGGRGPAGPSATDLDKLTVGAAIDPTGFRPSVPRPADFDSFWAGKLAVLAQVPINPQLTPVAAPKPNIDFFKVQLDSVGSKTQGYLATPRGGGKHPAIVLFQYAGVYALDPRTAADRAAEGWLAFNVDSHDIDPAGADGPRNYATMGDTDRETSYFLNMYLRDTRAIDYIRSRPDWDGKTIVVMGTSMGGQQSFVTAGLNPQYVTAMVVNVPSGMDVNGEKAGRRTGYPNWPSGDAAVMQTGQYFDPVNFAPRIKARSVVAFGLIDTTSPPAGVFTAFNLIAGPKEAIPMVNSDHNHITPQQQGAYLKRQQQVLAEILKTGSFTPNADWAK